MNISEIRELSKEELQEKIKQEKSAYSSLKLGHAIAPLENALDIRNKRRFIAKLSTVLTEKKNAK